MPGRLSAFILSEISSRTACAKPLWVDRHRRLALSRREALCEGCALTYKLSGPIREDRHPPGSSEELVSKAAHPKQPWRTTSRQIATLAISCEGFESFSGLAGVGCCDWLWLAGSDSSEPCHRWASDLNPRRMEAPLLQSWIRGDMCS